MGSEFNARSYLFAATLAANRKTRPWPPLRPTTSTSAEFASKSTCSRYFQMLPRRRRFRAAVAVIGIWPSRATTTKPRCEGKQHEKLYWMGRLPAAQFCPCGGVGLLHRVARRCCVVILLGGVGTILLLRDFSCWLAYVQNHKVAFGATRELSRALIGKHYLVSCPFLAYGGVKGAHKAAARTARRFTRASRNGRRGRAQRPLMQPEADPNPLRQRTGGALPPALCRPARDRRAFCHIGGGHRRGAA